MAPHNPRRRVGTFLLGLGLLVMLAIAGYFAWSEIESAQVRAALRQNVSAAAPTVRPTATASARPPDATPTTRPTQTATTEVAAVISPSATPSRALATETRTPATPSPVPTATPTQTATRPASRVEPVRLVIADLKIDARVVPMGWRTVQTASGPVSEWVIPKNDAGHHINSAGLGEIGNLVISGHNNIFGQVFKPISLAWDNDSRTKVDDFTDRSDILTGRTIELFDAAGTRHAYVISEFYRLKDTGVSRDQRIANGRYILPTEDERVTIVTCWPPTNNTHRLIVIARPAK